MVRGILDQDKNAIRKMRKAWGIWKVGKRPDRMVKLGDLKGNTGLVRLCVRVEGGTQESPEVVKTTRNFIQRI